MLVAVIPVYSLESSLALLAALPNGVDAIELRLDYWTEMDFSSLALLRQQIQKPIIFTPRTFDWQQLARLGELKPDYMDIEAHAPAALLAQLKTSYPTMQLIGSLHDMSRTPEDLDSLFAGMQSPYFDRYKCVTMANHSEDGLRMLQHVAKWSRTHAVSAFCMGDDGQFTRVVAPIFGSQLTYAALSAAHITAPGQLTVHELLDVYRVQRLTPYTRIYALLGDPVNQSIGHLFHNQAMHALDWPGVYIKIRVPIDQLAAVMARCSTLPFYGLSITMPLKQAILPFVTPMSPEGAMNTLVKQHDQWIAYNTDGEGALQALAARGVVFTGNTLVILGAGGTARAIAYAAQQRQARVIVLNRRLETLSWTESMGCEGYLLSDLPQLELGQVIAVINTRPESADMDANLFAQLGDTLVMNCAYKSEPAVSQQTKLINGYDMFENQAKLQLAYWMSIL
jgi:3-dehydroquinate dehydratase/shikimate dehydrogenase